MSDRTNRCFSPSNPDSFRDPDCLKCLRKKLQALCLVVFYRDADGWRLGGYQGDRPSAEAEVDFVYMLKEGLPELVAAHPGGLVLNDDMSIGDHIGKFRALLGGKAVIASAVNFPGLPGLRLAWRDQSEPFTTAELQALQCEGNCPEGC